jgi:serine/threonine protein phosphatase 1
MKTFVIPDLHGRVDLLNVALLKIQQYSSTGTVVCIGDYVDRGPDSKGVIDRLMQGPSEGWVWHCIRGNHEDMLLDCHDILNPIQRQWWLGHGGETTMKSYGGTIDPDHIEWINNLPRLHWDDLRVYTHAGVGEQFELHEQPESLTQWFKYPDRADVGYRGRHVVHGHVALVDGPECYTNRTNLDTKAYETGRLTVGVFDGTTSGPIDIITVKI